MEIGLPGMAGQNALRRVRREFLVQKQEIESAPTLHPAIMVECVWAVNEKRETATKIYRAQVSNDQ